MQTIELTSSPASPLSASDVQSRVEALFHRKDLRAVLVKRSLDARGSSLLLRHRVEVYGPDEEYEPYSARK